MAESTALTDLNRDYESRYGFHDPEEYLVKAPKGIDSSKGCRGNDNTASLGTSSAALSKQLGKKQVKIHLC